MSLVIALPRERRPSERRVALDPSRVERLVRSGVQVRIEAECGHTASFHDDDYPDVLVFDNFADVVREADIVVKVRCPTKTEIQHLMPGTILICIMSAFQHTEEVAELKRQKITVLAMDHLPRTTRAQPLDALSSQATVAGYKAALLAAELSPRLFPMLTTAAGTIRPSRVLVIGAGVAGLQAIATSRRLGAQVEAYDIRKAAKEQIESLGARMVDTGVEVEGAGGLARALRKDEKQKQHDVLARHLAKAHVVICAASIPGRRAPRIISEDMVDGMLPESVIVDLAASTGGNCELTRIGEHYHHNETLIVGPLNLPSHGAVHASEMYARNIYNMLQLIIVENEAVLNQEDEIIARCVLCHDGQINHGPTAGLLDVEHVVFGGAVHAAADLADQTAGWLRDADDPITADVSEISESAAASEGVEIKAAQELSKPNQIQGNFSTPDAAKSQVANGENESTQFADTAARGAPEDTTIALYSERGSEPVLKQTLDEEQITHRVDQNTDASTIVSDNDDQELDSREPDDLTLIDGVGPALQERLFAFGFLNLQQLAELDSVSADKLAIQLELGDEFEINNWIEQARQLVKSEVLK